MKKERERNGIPPCLQSICYRDPHPRTRERSSQDPCPCEGSRIDTGLGRETSFGRWAISKDVKSAGFTSAAAVGLASWGERDCVRVFSLSRVRFFATPWTVAHQCRLAVEVSRQEYRSRWPFPTPGESSRTKDRTSRARQAPHHRASRGAPRYT